MCSIPVEPALMGLRKLRPNTTTTPTLFYEQPPLRAMPHSVKRKFSRLQDSPSSGNMFDPLFNQPDADILLQTSDGGLFACRKEVLIAHSVIFEAMFDIPQAPPPTDNHPPPNPYADQQAPGVLPVVQMSETSPQLRIYLRWIHPHTHKKVHRESFRSWSFMSMESEELLWLLDLARKFETVSITESVLQMLVWQDKQSRPEPMLALGIIFCREDIVRLAIDRWVSASLDEWKDCSVRMIWPCLMERLPVRVFPHLSRAVDKLLVYEDIKADAELEEDKQERWAPPGEKATAWHDLKAERCQDFITAFNNDFPYPYVDDLSVFPWSPFLTLTSPIRSAKATETARAESSPEPEPV